MIIMLLVSLSFMLKLACQPIAGRVTECVICGTFILMALEYALGQSKTRIADSLQNPELMLDMAVLLTIDVFIQITYCITDAKRISGDMMSRKDNILDILTLWFPGILVFPTLFALLVETIFAFPGQNFNTTAYILTGTVIVAGILLPTLIKKLIPEEDLRLELIFMVNVLIAILGVVASVNGRAAVAGVNDVELMPLLGVALIMLTGGVAGYLLFRRKTHMKRREI